MRDRFAEPARDAVAASAGEVTEAGFDGVHLAISPVTTNDPSLPDLLERTREEIGDDAVLSVQAQHVEPVSGARIPSFVVAREEKYWSKGYLRRVAEHADVVVVPGHGTGMPVSSLYGGFMVRQTKESLAALEPLSGNGGAEDAEDGQDGSGPAVRFGVPSYQSENWAPVSSAESVETAARGIRLGLTDHGRRDGAGVGLAVYVLDDTGEEDWAALTDGWLNPQR
ncbi:hypothetical protein [Allosalinactinospora lopnorensis]|uniref:hypothetical protein n=1 Tax=Allosalinactinospora lopnorensis TaxID=1352348 RepID=UPI0030843B93